MALAVGAVPEVEAVAGEREVEEGDEEVEVCCMYTGFPYLITPIRGQENESARALATLITSPRVIL